MSPAATPLWKLGQLVMLGGTSMFPLFRSTVVFLGGARPGCNHRKKDMYRNFIHKEHLCNIISLKGICPDLSFALLDIKIFLSFVLYDINKGHHVLFSHYL